MPLPKPNLHPPFNIVRLSHVELAVTDLQKSRAKATTAGSSIARTPCCTRVTPSN